jgi:hypothetical protein
MTPRSYEQSNRSYERFNDLDERQRETVFTYCLNCDDVRRRRALKASIAPRFKLVTEWCSRCGRDTPHEER